MAIATARRRPRVHALALVQRQPERYDLVERNFVRGGIFRPGRARRRSDEWRSLGVHEGEEVRVRGDVTFRDGYILERLMAAYRRQACPADRIVQATIRDLFGPLYRGRKNRRDYQRMAAQLERLQEFDVAMIMRLGRRLLPYRRFGLLESFDLRAGRYVLSVEMAEIARDGASFAIVESERYVALLRTSELGAALWRWLEGHEWSETTRRRVPAETVVNVLGLSDERPWRTRAIAERAIADVAAHDPTYRLAIADGERGRWALDVVRVHRALGTGPQGADVRDHRALDYGTTGRDVRDHRALAEHESGTEAIEPVRGRGEPPRTPRTDDEFTERQRRVLEDIEAEHRDAGEEGWVELHLRNADDRGVDGYRLVVDEHRAWRQRRRDAGGERPRSTWTPSAADLAEIDKAHGHDVGAAS